MLSKNRSASYWWRVLPDSQSVSREKHPSNVGQKIQITSHDFHEFLPWVHPTWLCAIIPINNFAAKEPWTIKQHVYTRWYRNSMPQKRLKFNHSAGKKPILPPYKRNQHYDQWLWWNFKMSDKSSIKQLFNPFPRTKSLSSSTPSFNTMKKSIKSGNFLPSNLSINIFIIGFLRGRWWFPIFSVIFPKVPQSSQTESLDILRA